MTSEIKCTRGAERINTLTAQIYHFLCQKKAALSKLRVNLGFICNFLRVFHLHRPLFDIHLDPLHFLMNSAVG